MVLVALLAGCAPTPEVPVAEPTVAAPSATPTVEPVADPRPLFDIACDEILPASAYTPLSTTPLAASDVFELTADGVYYGIPQVYSIAQLQGTQCVWVNDEPESDENGHSDLYTRLSIDILPNAADAWHTYEEMYATSPEFTTASCNGADGVNARCWWSGLLDDTTWAEITYDGMKNFGSDSKNVAQFKPLIPLVRAAIEGSSATAEWTAPADTTPIADGCPSVLTAEAIASTVGGKASDVHFFDDYIGGTSLVFEAERMVGSNPCRWNTPTTEAEYGLPFQILRGGEWAWEAARGTLFEAQQVDLDGLVEGDSAWLRVEEQLTTMHLIIGGNWIAIEVYPEALEKVEISETDLLTELAEKVAAEVYAS